MKKLFYCLIIFVSLFVFSNNVEALQCLYESSDGDQVFLTQFFTKNLFGDKNYVAYVEAFGPIEVNGKSIEADYYTTKVYNFIGDFGGKYWHISTSCPKELLWDETALDDEIYVGLDHEYDEKFSLVEPYGGKTPNHVGLSKLVCTYASSNEENYNESYTFVIDPSTQKYSLWKNHDFLYDEDYNKENGINKTIHHALSGTYQGESYFDSFTIRTFWSEELGYYICPDAIAVTDECEINALLGSSDCTYYIGYSNRANPDEKFEEIDRLVESDGFLWSQISSVEASAYYLAEGGSYIEYDSSVSEEKLCAYTYKGKECDPTEYDCEPLTLINLMATTYANGTKKITPVLNESYNYREVKNDTNISNDVDLTSCNNAPDLYTDCFTTEGSETCKVTTEYFEGSEHLVTDDWTNTQDSDNVQENMGLYNGLHYRTLLCELSDRLKVYVDPSTLNSLPELYIHSPNISKTNFRINTLDCEEWGISTGYTCNNETCKNNAIYVVERKVSEIKEYCNDVYNNYMKKYKTDNAYYQRKDECLKFNLFYNNMVEKGIITDLSHGCDFITSDLEEKLIFILDLIKIAGPILALGLGTLDFIKVVASGDTDKEMKTAFKRFSYRMVAAILLFIIPVILAFLMDIFIGNEDGYDPDNPFCDVIEWEEV